MNTAIAEKTTLHDAAREGDVTRVAQLVQERKEDVWVKTKDGWLPIHFAAFFGGPTIVRFFVVYSNSHPEDSDIVNAQINTGHTPLHLAAEKVDAASLELLVEQGRADPWIKAEYGLLPIHSAAEYGHPEAVRFFLRYNASHPQQGDMLNDRDNVGTTPLSWAVQNGHLECVRLLLLAGADVIISNKKGNRPIDFAERNTGPRGREILYELKRQLSIKEKYEIDDGMIGIGAYGSVTRAVNKITREEFAKKTTKPMLTDGKTYREIQVMEKLSHRNVVRLFEHFLVEKDGKTSITLIMELCHQSLYDWLERHPFEKRRPGSVTRMLLGLSNGLAYVHENRVIHRDLHPGNVLIKLINGKEIVKITDFELSVAVDTGNTSHTDRVGHWFYRAPEMAPPDESRRLKYDFKVDVYAEGFIFYELLADFKFSDRRRHLEQALNSFFVENVRRDFPKERDLIIQMLREDPSKRPTSSEVAEKARELHFRETGEKEDLEDNQTTAVDERGGVPEQKNVRRGIGALLSRTVRGIRSVFRTSSNS